MADMATLVEVEVAWKQLLEETGMMSIDKEDPISLAKPGWLHRS